MELQLVNPEEMSNEPVAVEEIQEEGQSVGQITRGGISGDHVTNIEEFEVSQDVKETLNGAYSLAEQMLDAEGYKGYDFYHPRYGHGIVCFVKEGSAIILDYHGKNLLTMEVLPDEEAMQFIAKVKSVFGEDAVN